MISYLVFTFDNLQFSARLIFLVKSDTFMRLYFLFCFSNLNQSIYIRLAEVSIGYALTTNDTKSGIYLYFFLFTPHGNFNVQKHTYTKQEQCKEKKQTNKQTNNTPPPGQKTKQNIFVFCLNLLQDAKIPFRFFIWREKERDLTQ